MISLLVFILILLLVGGGVWGWPMVAAALGLSSVTDKPAALKHIKQLMTTYDIAPSEVEAVFHTPVSTDDMPGKRSKGDIAKTLFTYLGAVFIIAGVGTYIGSFWDTMGSAMRVLVTLGVGYVLLFVLVAALHENRYPILVLPLTLASVFMMSAGWFVLVDEMYPNISSWQAPTLFVCGVMAIHQGVLFTRYRRTALAFTTLFFTYAFAHVGLDMLGLALAYIAIVLGASLFVVGAALEKTPHRPLAEVALLIGACWLNSGLFDLIALFTAGNWAGLIVGANLMLTAFGLHKADRYPRLIAIGYFTGSVLAYAALFDLVQNSPLELIYLAVTASGLYACVVLESRALLLTTVIAMLGFIGYFSAKHFADSLGWPITLILMGVAFFGVGAFALKMKQRM
ncbi:MAG: hypothetical protein WBN40_14065 [Pseudomonadales bacterium]